MPSHYPGTECERGALGAYIKLSRAASAVEGRVNRHLAEAGLTLSQFGVLESIHHLGPMNQGQLAGKILKSSGNLTTVIDNLERRGLVERRRDLHDRRSNQIHLTEAGRELIERLLPPHVRGVVEAFSILTDDERDTLAGLCRKLGLAQAVASRD